MPQTAQDVPAFLALVRKSGLLSDDALREQFPSGADLPRTPHEAAALLVAAQRLTHYQARQLLSGKYRGFILGPYRVQEPIGRGGMGTVFLAEHNELRRKVALKVLSTNKSQDKLTLERFFREARSAAALDHPNIVRLYDVSQGGGVYFLIMEYVEGNDLQSLMAKTGPLHHAQAAHYIAQAAAGLQHAHEKGFVHRDIKPANLILTKDGVVKILDLGLTRSLDNEQDNLTEMNGEDTSVTGTVDFISPEQALGAPVDQRSDIYNLGATLFALLTGQPPFGGTTTQKLMQHQFQDPQALLKKLKGKAPAALSDVVLKMMAREAADRYQTTGDVIDALGPWLPAATSGNVVKDPVSLTSLPAPEPQPGPEPGPESRSKSKSKSKSKSRSRSELRRLEARPGRNWKMIAVVGGILVTACALGLALAVARVHNSASESGGAPRTAGPPERVARFDFTGLAPGIEEVRAQVRSSNTLNRQPLPPGWEISQFGTTADADYVIEDVAGSRALGIRHLGGTFGPQVIYMPHADWPSLRIGEAMTFRLEYRYEGKGMGYACVQHHYPPFEKYALVELPPTVQWRLIDVLFTRSTDKPFTLTFSTAHPTRRDEPAEGTLWVRSLEVWHGVP
jgi:serine/threonine protein kinase